MQTQNPHDNLSRGRRYHRIVNGLGLALGAALATSCIIATIRFFPRFRFFDIIYPRILSNHPISTPSTTIAFLNRFVLAGNVFACGRYPGCLL